MDPQQKACLDGSRFTWDRFEVVGTPRYGGHYELGSRVTITAAAHQDKHTWDAQAKRCNSAVGPVQVSFDAVRHPPGKEDGTTPITVTGLTTNGSSGTTFAIDLSTAGTYVVTAESSVRRSVTLTTVYPYDIVYDATDLNGFALDPRWGSQTYVPQIPVPDPTAVGPHIASCIGGNPVCLDGYTDEDLLCQRWGANPDTMKKESLPNPFTRFNCTTQATFMDEPPGAQESLCTLVNGFTGGQLSAIAPLYGHLTWTNQVVTVEAPMQWDGAAPECDRDYSFNIYPAHGGLTTEGNTNLHCEFDSQETIGYGSDSPSWPGFWKELRADVEQSWKLGPQYFSADCHSENFDQSKIKSYLYGKNAIVIGVPGLDAAHANWPRPAAMFELHPVIGLGIDLGDTTVGKIREPIARLPASTVVDRWAFFARNWGDGGAGPTPCSETVYEIPSVQKLQFRIRWPPGASDASIAAQNFVGQGSGTVAIHKGSDIVVAFEIPPAAQHQNEVGEVWVHWTFEKGRPKPTPAPLDKLVKRASEDNPGPALERVLGSLNEAQMRQWTAAMKAPSAPPHITPTPAAPASTSLIRPVPSDRAAADAARAKKALCDIFAGKLPKSFQSLGACSL